MKLLNTLSRSLFLLALLASSVVATAQRFPRHELSSSTGFGPNWADHRVNNVVNRYNDRYDLEWDSSDFLITSPIVQNLEYHYRLNRQFAVGATMGWGISEESYTGHTFITDHKVECRSGSEQSRIFFFAPSFRYTWYVRGPIQLYSRVAVGVMRQHTKYDLNKRFYRVSYNDLHWTPISDNIYLPDQSYDDIKWKPTCQLTPVGFSVGSRFIRFFAELGYGCQGVYNMGLRLAY